MNKSTLIVAAMLANAVLLDEKLSRSAGRARHSRTTPITTPDDAEALKRIRATFPHKPGKPVR